MAALIDGFTDDLPDDSAEDPHSTTALAAAITDTFSDVSAEDPHAIALVSAHYIETGTGSKESWGIVGE